VGLRILRRASFGSDDGGDGEHDGLSEGLKCLSPRSTRLVGAWSQSRLIFSFGRCQPVAHNLSKTVLQASALSTSVLSVDVVNPSPPIALSGSVLSANERSRPAKAKVENRGLAV